MPKTILNVLRDHPRLLSTGFLLVFFSVFGQSIFLGYYIPLIQEDYGLTNSTVGGLYAAATIASSLAIILTGKGLDKIPLRNFSSLVLVGLAAGCFLMAGSRTPILLFIAFFLLRQCGQGLLPLTTHTAINRYLYKNRGKAVAIANFGGPAHIMLFPMLAIAVSALLPWRTAWLLYGAFILVVLLPFFRFLLRNHEKTTHASWKKHTESKSEEALAALMESWPRKHVLKDWRFYALVAVIFLPPFVGTAVFFYQRPLAENLGFSTLEFAGAFPFFTVFSIVCALCAGIVIDRYSEKPVLIAYPLIYAVGILLTTKGATLPALYLGMGLLGGGAGMMSTTGGPLLAHMYGTKHLGSIKALTMAAGILSSALSPFIFGVFIDLGYDIAHTLSWLAWYSAVIWVLAFPIFKTIKRA